MATTSQNPSPSSPTKLGGFELLDILGEGGMGIVYRARQLSLDRVVALKVLSHRVADDPKYTDSFLREAKSAARLQHPNIVAVHDAGKADSRYYYAMEFVRGETLHKWLQRDGALPEETVLGVGICIANALKHGWDKERLIHRDIKPDNIIIDTDGNVKVLDLGLAKTFGENTLLSLSGQVFGTPQYMSPEQARGDKGIDFRTDIYGLGMTLYHALTGQIPFHGGTAGVVMARQMHEQLEDPREHAPDASPHFCRVLEKMLAKNADDRYASWDDVLRDLNLARENSPPQIPLIFNGTSSMKRLGALRAERGAGSVERRAQENVEAESLPPEPVLEGRAPSRPLPHPSPTIGRDGARPSKKSRSTLIALTLLVSLLVLAAGGYFFFARSSPNTNDPVARLDAIKQFAQENPSRLLDLEDRLRGFLAEFPNSPQTKEANAMLASVMQEKARFAPLSEDELTRRQREQEEAQKKYEEALALARTESEKNDQLVEQLQSIIKQFPNTREAEQARQALEAMNDGGAPPSSREARRRLLGTLFDRGGRRRTPDVQAPTSDPVLTVEPLAELAPMAPTYSFKGSHNYMSVVLGTNGLFATGGFYGQLEIWNSKTGQLVFSQSFPSAKIKHLSVSPDGKTLAVVTGRVHLYDFASGRKMVEITSDSRIEKTQFSADATKLATVQAKQNDTSEIRLWDAITSELMLTYRSPKKIVGGADVAFCPNGLLILSGYSLYLWNLKNEEATEMELTLTSKINRGFSADGSHLLGVPIQGRSGTISETASGKISRLFNGVHSTEAGLRHYSHTSISYDGRMLVQAYDAILRLTDFEAKTTRILQGPTQMVSAIAFSRDGKNLIATTATDGDYKIFIWNLTEQGKSSTVVPSSQPTSSSQPKPEDDSKRAEAQALMEAERVKVLQAFGEFQKSFLASLAKRDYAGAQQQAQQMSDNPLFESLKERAVAFGEVATRLDKFWSSLSVTLAALKGKPVTAQGETGVVSGVTKVNLELEKSVTGGTVVAEIPFADLTVEELATLLTQAKPNDKETSLTLAFWYLAEGKPAQADASLEEARRLGADIKAALQILDWLSNNPKEMEAQKLLNQIRKLMSDKNWADAVSTIKLLNQTYGQTETVMSARTELSNLESVVTRNDEWAKIPSGSVMRTIQAHKGGVRSVRFSPDGKLIASAGGWTDRLIKLWDTETGKELQSREGAGSGSTVHFAAVSPDGKTFLGVGSYQVMLWNAASGDEIRRFPPLSQSRHVVFSPDGKHLLGDGLAVKLVNVATGDEVRRYGDQPAACAAFTPDGRNVLAAVNDGTIGKVNVWDAATGRELRAFSGHTSYVNLVTVSPDGRVALSTSKNELKLWEIATGREIRSYDPPMESYWDIAFSPDGKYLIAAANSVRIWETTTGRAVQTIRGNAKSAVFSPDGRFILTGNSDGTIKLLKFSDDNAPR